MGLKEFLGRSKSTNRYPGKWPFALALLASLLFPGCDRPQETSPPVVPEVGVVTVQSRKIVLTTDLPGRTCAYLVAEIRPQVSGLVQKRLFAEGSDVKAGEVLYQIDPTPFQAALDNANANLLAARKAADRARADVATSIAGLKRHEATLALAKINFERYQKLIKQKAVSAMDHDQGAADVQVAEAALRTAQAQVESGREAVGVADAAIQQAEAAKETARINLGYTRVIAPISGRIGRSNLTEGAIATAYQPLALATIQQLDPIYVDVPQSTVELNRLRRSLSNGHLKENGTDRVKIILEDGTAYPQEGTLKFRDVTVDPTTGSVILRIVVPNPEVILLPNMFVRAVIDEGMRENAILISQQAVTRDSKGNPTAMVIDAQGKAQQRSISTERALGDQWLVSGGLTAGDRVIVEGLQKVRPGTPVKAIPLDRGQAAAANPEKTTRTITSK